MIIKSQLCFSLLPFFKLIWLAIKDSMTMDCNAATPDTNNFKHIANV